MMSWVIAGVFPYMCMPSYEKGKETMDKDKLFDALDGLFAYDSGEADGICDRCLKAEVVAYLEAELEKPEGEHRLYPKIVDEFVSYR